MTHLFFLVALCGLIGAVSNPAFAQMQQGYSGEYGSPEVQVDRSVLEDLKDYQPPPMFGTPTTDAIITKPGETSPVEVTPPQIAPLDTPSLTAPKAEDILNHPVENFHVLTEHNPQLTVPEVPSKTISNNTPLLPLPDEDTPPKKTTKSTAKIPPLPKHKPKQLAAVSEPVTKTVKVAPKPEPEKVIIEKNVATPQPAAAPKPTNAYRPKASKSMPAIPPVEVEKSELPSLPPTMPDNTEKTKPSIGERMMDAALMDHIESNEEAIKEKLKSTEVKQMAPSTKEPIKTFAPVEPKSPTSLVFSANQMTLSKEIETQIQKNILPRARKESQSRIQILSFATAKDGTESSARRVSLSRALAVRDYLLTQKVDASRIDVRALANQGNSSPANRIDFVFLIPQ